MVGTTVKVAVAAAVAVAGLAGCGDRPLKMGAAALVGDDRITTTTLDQAVRDCQKHFKADQTANQVRAALERQQQQPGSADTAECGTRDALNLMVNIKVADEVAKEAGVSVTGGQVDQTIALLSREAPAESIVVALGLPKSYTRDFARMNAVQALLFQKFGADGNSESPATQQAQQAALTLFQKTADKMDIKINPRFGSFDKSQISISPVTYKLSSTESGIR